MFPAFRSTKSAIGFCVLLISLLGLPLVTSWLGHPSREQAYAALTSEAGPVGMHVREIYADPGDVDVLLLGSSLVRAGVDRDAMEQALAAHLKRPARVRILAMNWQGIDFQYFLLADYLGHHRVGLILWNAPVPGSRNLEPHVEAFRWVRYGESSALLAGLPWRYRMALYGDMVLGAPREILTHLRPNQLGPDEMQFLQSPEAVGYYGQKFIPEPADLALAPPLEVTFQEPPYPLVREKGKPFDFYETYFAKRILMLAAENHTRIAMLHIPIDSERGLDSMPERSRLDGALDSQAPFIGVTSAALFLGVPADRFQHFYTDQHFNTNGRALFTRAIMPAVLKAYDGGRTP